MSVGPTNMASSLAATQLAQTKGSDVDRTTHERSNQTQKSKADQKAANVEGVGETEQDSGVADRDADGRRVWELGEEPSENDDAEEQTSADKDTPKSKDATGQRGKQLDLSG